MVQIYVSDMFSSLSRPITELVGFKRIELITGEKKKFYFALDLSQLAFLDKKMKWKIEKRRVYSHDRNLFKRYKA